MSLKKAQDRATSPKRANAPLRCDYTKDFEKDWERIKRAGRQNLQRAKDGILHLVAHGGNLPPEYLDHPLTGNYAGHREFHAGGDLLVIYFFDSKDREVTFTRIGTHAELFD